MMISISSYQRTAHHNSFSPFKTLFEDTLASSLAMSVDATLIRPAATGESIQYHDRLKISASVQDKSCYSHHHHQHHHLCLLRHRREEGGEKAPFRVLFTPSAQACSFQQHQA